MKKLTNHEVGLRPWEKESFYVGDAVSIIRTKYSGIITGISEDMPLYPLIVSVGNGKVWRFSLDGQTTINSSIASLRKFPPTPPSDPGIGEA